MRVETYVDVLVWFVKFVVLRQALDFDLTMVISKFILKVMVVIIRVSMFAFVVYVDVQWILVLALTIVKARGLSSMNRSR